MRIALIVLCFFFPFLAVLIKDGPSGKVLIALLLQLLGHFPGVIYGLVVVTRDQRSTIGGVSGRAPRSAAPAAR